MNEEDITLRVNLTISKNKVEHAKLEIELEKLKHEHILEEIKLLKNAKITKFVRGKE